jgi:CheY-like chemotaxis protein
MITAYGREEVMNRADKLGLSGCLLKPVNPSVLFDAVMLAFGAEAPQPTNAARRVDVSDTALKRLHGQHLLLVEDNEINQQVAREILEGAGLQVTIANNGLEAVELAKKKDFRAILMDIQMPVMDGYEATKRIRNAECGERRKEVEKIGSWEVGKKSNIQHTTYNTPIIAMTAHAMAGDAEKSIKAGMNDHVTKPIDRDQLFAALLKWIQPPKDQEPIDRAQDAAETVPAETTAAGDMGLPDIMPGFDLADGLRRLQGNKKLYRKLLLNFAEKYGESTQEIRTALEAEDFELAHQVVHAIKGVAGNLAAPNLLAAATNLEKQVKGADPKHPPHPEDLNRDLADFELALQHALQSVHQLETPFKTGSPMSTNGKVGAMEDGHARKYAEQMRDAAEMGDMTALYDIAAEIRNLSAAYEPLGMQLQQLTEDIDFEGILNLADELDGISET